MTSFLRCYSGPSGVKAIMDWLPASQMMSHPVFRFHLPSEFVQPVLILTEGVARRGHDQAAFDAGSASSVPAQEFIEPGRRAIG
jgi:hypothetical protein